MLDVRLENCDSLWGISDYKGNDHRTFFSTTKVSGHLVSFDLGCFLDLTVFTLLSHKGKKSVIIPPYLHSILNTCNVLTRSFTYSCVKTELVKPCSPLIFSSDSMWAAAVITWYWIVIVFIQPPRWQGCFFSRIVYIRPVHIGSIVTFWMLNYINKTFNTLSVMLKLL